MKQKFYLQTWFIAFLFALWPFVFPTIIGVFLLLRQNKYFNNITENAILEITQKKEILEKEIEQLKYNRDKEKEKILAELSSESKNINEQIIDNSNKLDILLAKIKEKEKEIFELDDIIESQDFGLYKPKYNCMNSEEYREKIQAVRAKQKDMISNKTALKYFADWTLDGSKAKGRAMNNDNMKITLLAFNGEADKLINKVKYNNVYKIEERIRKIAEKIDRLNTRNKITIKSDYINLKIEELYLSYEYEQKKQDEKEEIRRIREEEREAAKLEKEIKEARKNIDKEEAHFEQALENLKKQLSTTNNDEKVLLLQKKIELEQHLNEIHEKIKELDYRESNARAGYVYVISNIGSFGENIYKIGMTRRLEPLDRVNELGDASVPFKFDVHAMIFSDDAPKLEAALHNAFNDKKVNMINNRKEFFNVTLEEIEDVVKNNFEKTVEFSRIAEAQEYRESQVILKHKKTSAC